MVKSAGILNTTSYFAFEAGPHRDQAGLKTGNSPSPPVSWYYNCDSQDQLIYFEDSTEQDLQTDLELETELS